MLPRCRRANQGGFCWDCSGSGLRCLMWSAGTLAGTPASHTPAALALDA